MDKYINGQKVTAIGFAFDGCHKFYLLENEADCKKLEGYGYNLYAIAGLPRAWADSCPLRFIESADLTKQYVGQGEPAHFEGWFIEPGLKWELEALEQEQLEALEDCPQ